MPLQISGKPIPSWLSNYKTRDDFNKELEVEKIQYALAERGYLIESDFDGMSASTKAAYSTQIKRDAEFIPSSNDVKAAQRLIGTVAQTKAGTTIGNDGLGNEAYETIRINAGASINSFTGNTVKVVLMRSKLSSVLNDVTAEIKDGTIKPTLEPGTDGFTVTEYTAAQQQLDKDPTSWRTQVLTGTRYFSSAATAIPRHWCWTNPQPFTRLLLVLRKVSLLGMLGCSAQSCYGHGTDPLPHAVS